MREVNFTEIGMKNYQCYIDPMIIPIIPGTLTLIIGPNGIGKTALFDCFPFTFYGVTTKGARADDVVNNRVEKNCHTWVKMEVDRSNYVADRYHKHAKYGNTAILSKEGEPIFKGHKEVRPALEALVAPQKLFLNTLLFGQKVNTFFTDLPDSEQKEIFRKVMLLDEYLLYQKEATTRAGETQALIQEAENKITVMLSILEQTTADISILETNKWTFENQKAEEIEQITQRMKCLMSDLTEYEGKELDENKIRKDLDVCRDQIAENKAKLASIDTTLQGIISEINAKRQQREAALQQDFLKQKESLQKLVQDEMGTEFETNKDDQFDLAAVIAKLDSDILVAENALHQNMLNKEGLLVQEKKFTENVLEGSVSTCPTCNQKIDGKVLDDLTKHVQHIRGEVELLDISIDQSTKKIQEMTQEKAARQLERQKVENYAKILQSKHEEAFAKDLRLIEEKYAESLAAFARAAQSEIDEEKEKSQKSWGQLRDEAKDLSTKKASLETNLDEVYSGQRVVNQLKIDIKAEENKLEEKRKEKFDDSQLKSLKKKITDTENMKKEAGEEIQHLLDLKEILEFWREGFSSAGIPSMLIDEAIPFMNSRVSTYLDKIGGRYSVSFDTLKATKAGEFRDKISVNVYDSVTWANKRTQFSGGQTRVVDISTILTLGDLQEMTQGVRFNILLFDEIFDALDDQNAEYVSQLLSVIKKDKAVFVISHKNIEQIEADEVLHLY